VFEAITGIFGATADEPFAFTSGSKLFEGVGSGRFNQAETWNGGV
jgi:hypothetical protein